MTTDLEQGSERPDSTQETPPEKIRPDLNLEKWSIWQPAHSKNTKARTLTRQVEVNGQLLPQEVTIDYTDLLGTLTTEDQKTCYALFKQWQDKGMPEEETYFSLNGLMKILRKGRGTNTTERLVQSLNRLLGVSIFWKNAYFDPSTGEVEETLQGFHIIDGLKIIRRKKDGHITREEGYFKWNDFIKKSLKANYTKTKLLDTAVSFTNEIAQILYTHLDLILADKTRYERRTKELFEDLGLHGKSYIKPTKRKQVLLPALTELHGKPLSTGTLKTLALEPTKDGQDFKLVATKSTRKAPAPAAPEPEVVEQVSEPPIPPAKTKLIEEARKLINHFYQLFHSSSGAHISNKAMNQAISLIAAHGYDQAKYIIDFAHQEAPKTNYEPQTFGGIIQYESRAIAAFAEQQRRAELAQAQAADSALAQSCPFCYGTGWKKVSGTNSVTRCAHQPPPNTPTSGPSVPQEPSEAASPALPLAASDQTVVAPATAKEEPSRPAHNEPDRHLL